MIHPDKAFEIIINSKINLENLKKENIPVINAQGRVIAEDIYSSIDYPAFNKSAMDGFTYNSSDNSEIFKVIETVPAGFIAEKNIGHGECYRIMTGAKVPADADRVVRFEYVDEKDDFIKIIKQEKGTNICYQAEDLKKNDKILKTGTLIRSQEIATMSMLGLAEVSVYKQPVAGLIITGSEIIDQGKEMEQGKIYNSNGPQLYSQIVSMPILCKYYGVVKDEESLIAEFFEKAFEECDIIVVSGGVSMGDYDFVPHILKKLSVDLKFEQVAVKPGKALLFGQKNKTFVFGLPGNPVSTFISFEMFVKPLIFKMMGHDFKPVIYKGKLAETIKRKNPDRLEYRPVYFDGRHIHKIEYHGSGHISALINSNAIIRIEQGISEIKKDEIIDVRQI
ncbi:MAG: molybdopterin molybdotransferase MoeA [bacterium]